MTKPDRIGTPEPTRPAKACLDPASQRHVRSFLSVALILMVFNLPLLLLRSFQPTPILAKMKLIFGVVAWVAAILAVQQRQRPLSPSLNLWDEAAAFLALALTCSIALDIVG